MERSLDTSLMQLRLRFIIIVNVYAKEKNTLLTTHANVATESPSINLKKLCRHFGHKIEVEFDDARGEIRFPFGTATLEARESLLQLRGSAATEEELERLEQVVADHLVRFANKETLSIEWQREA